MSIDEVKTKYSVWLEETTLDHLFSVKSLKEEEGFYRLTLVGKPSNPKLLSNGWQFVEDSLNSVEVELSHLLIYRLSQLSGHPLSLCEVSLESQNKYIFGGQISYRDDSIRSTVEYVTQRDLVVDLKLEMSLILPNPQGVFNCQGNLEDCQSKTQKALVQYLKSRKISPKNMITNQSNVTVRYELSNLKKVITDRYYERLMFEFSFHELQKGLVEVNYELSAWYASGFSEPGEFRDMKKSFYEELVLFSSPFQMFFRKEVNR